MDEAIAWATLPLKKFTDFNGRSRRKEYWMFVLLCVAAGIVTRILDGIIGLSAWGTTGPFTLLLSLALILPATSVGIRRLHDTGRPGTWILLGLAPALCSIILTPILIFMPGGFALLGLLSLVYLGCALVLIYFFAQEGTRGPNQYGADPLEAERAPRPAI